MNRARHKYRSNRRRGVTLPFMLLSFVVFIVFAAMTIDTAYMQLVRTQLRVATDAAARAGAESLSESQDPTTAFQAALTSAQQNMVGGQPMQIAVDDVEFGCVVKQADGSWQFQDARSPLTACRVHAKLGRGEARGPVPLLLGSVLGVETFSPNEISTSAFTENEVCLVVDRSHSMCFDMSGDDFVYPPGIPPYPDGYTVPPHATLSRWASLREGLDLFLDIISEVSANQKVALVTWASNISSTSYEGARTGRSFPATALDVPLGTDYQAIRSVAATRGSEVMLGATNMSAGITMGTSVLTGPDSRPQSIKIMIVMTDGKWNQGSNPVTAAAAARQAGITVHTITFLDAANQKDMQQVAKVGGGQHYHASDRASLLNVFRELAHSLPVSMTE